jgi:hypothetical protein
MCFRGKRSLYRWWTWIGYQQLSEQSDSCPTYRLAFKKKRGRTEFVYTAGHKVSTAVFPCLDRSIERFNDQGKEPS